MSKKYIGQIDNPNFVYPNNNLEQYDIEIVHDINNQSVQGSISGFTATSATSTGITLTFFYYWTSNGAEPFILDDGNYSFLSVHMMEPSLTYFKPWRTVYNAEGSANTEKSDTVTFTVTPAMMGVNSFTSGNYYFEIRMLGKRATYPLNSTLTLSIAGPTPTPTVTPTLTTTPTSTPGASPTPTVTPSATPNQISTIYKSGATINVTDTGYIKYDTSTDTDVYQFINTLGVVTLTACIDCSTIFIGVPFADVANFTIIQCGTGCSGVPTPSPTPTSSPAASYGYYQMTDCQNYFTRYSQQLPYGSFNSGDRVEGSSGYYYVIQGFTPSYQAETYYVSGTGQYGCP
jgi:hypothetical protein